MAITQKKRDALNMVEENLIALRKYRGVKPLNEQELDNTFDYILRYARTISDIESKAYQLKESTKQPLKPASEKQVNFIKKLTNKEYNRKWEFLPNLHLNTYQAGEIIDFYIKVEDTIYAKMVCKEDFDDLDAEEIALIEWYKSLA